MRREDLIAYVNNEDRRYWRRFESLKWIPQTIRDHNPAYVLDFQKNALAQTVVASGDVGGASAADLAVITNAAFTSALENATFGTHLFLDSASDLVLNSADYKPDYGNSVRQALLRPSLTNKVTCRKHNPTDTTNITKSGDAASTLTVVDDSAELASAGLDQICTNGNVYKLDNSAGVAVAYAEISGATGNTNTHSVGVYARTDIGGGVGLLGVGFSDFSNTSYAYVKHENLTPLGVGAYHRVRADVGATVYFILPGLYEASAAPLYPIPGDTLAAVTETADNFELDDLAKALRAAGHTVLAWKHDSTPDTLAADTLSNGFHYDGVAIFHSTTDTTAIEALKWTEL